MGAALTGAAPFFRQRLQQGKQRGAADSETLPVEGATVLELGFEAQGAQNMQAISQAWQGNPSKELAALKHVMLRMADQMGYPLPTPFHVEMYASDRTLVALVVYYQCPETNMLFSFWVTQLCRWTKQLCAFGDVVSKVVKLSKVNFDALKPVLDRSYGAVLSGNSGDRFRVLQDSLPKLISRTEDVAESIESVYDERRQTSMSLKDLMGDHMWTQKDSDQQREELLAARGKVYFPDEYRIERDADGKIKSIEFTDFPRVSAKCTYQDVFEFDNGERQVWVANKEFLAEHSQVFHAETGTGGALQPVSSGWERLAPFERQDLEALEVWKSVTFKERNTHRKIQDMLQPETKALPMLLHWGMALPAEVEVRVNGYDADFRAKFQEAVRFVRRFRLQEYPAEWVPGDDRANAVGVARQRVVVKGGEEGITLPSVNYLDWALNHLILAILGRDQKGKKPELILLDGTSDGESGAGPGSGSGSYDHFASSSCGMQKEHLHLPLRLPPPDGSKSELSTLDTRIDSQGDRTHHASSSFCSSSGSGNSSNRSNSSSSGGGGGSAMKNPSLSLVCSTTQPLETSALTPLLLPNAPEQGLGLPLGSNARCCCVVMNGILEAMAKCVLTAADQRRDEASMTEKRPELVVFVADPPMPVMMGPVRGPEHESDNDPTMGSESEAAASLVPATPWSSEEEQQEAAANLCPPPPASPEVQALRDSPVEPLTLLLDVFLPQDGEHG